MSESKSGAATRRAYAQRRAEERKKQKNKASAQEMQALRDKSYASLLTASKLPIGDLTAQNARMRPISKTGNQTADFFVNSHGNLSPMELLRKDLATGQTVKSKTDRAKLLGLANTPKARTPKQEQEDNPLLSAYDLRNLTPGSQSLVKEAKTEYDRAKAAGDTAGMEKAHEKAETIRRQFGYSGGVAGSQYLSPKLTSGEKILLTTEGERQLRKARMEGDEEREAEVLAAPGFREYTNYAENQKKRERILSGAKAAGTGVAGALLSLSETGRQAMRNYQQDRWGSNAKAAIDALPLWRARLEMMQEGRGVDAWGTEAEIQERIKQGEAALASQSTRRTVDYNLPGQKLMRASQQYAQEATAGTEGLPRFLANTAISGAQMLPAIAASFIPGAGPAVGAGIMGAQAAGAKAYEVNEAGAEAGEAMTRGLISGGIEGLTERMGIGNLVELVTRSGGASFLKNVAKQAGIEATEESASYVLNLAADVAAENPNAQVSLSDFINGMADQFSFSELAQNAAAGALLGGTFAGAGTAINRAMNRDTANPAQTTQEAPDNPLLRASGFYDRQAENEAEEVQEAGEPVLTAQEAAPEAVDPLRDRKLDWNRRNDDLRARIQAEADSGRPMTEEAHDNFLREIKQLQTEAAEIVQDERREDGQVSANFGQAESHIDRRTNENVRARNVKAFQFDHPQLHQYYAKAAEALIRDAEYSFETQQSKRGTGTIVRRSEPLSKAEGLGLTRNEVIQVCQDIIADKGQENYAAAKRVELILDDMLSKGYIPNEGTTQADTKVPANQDYIQAKEAIPGAVTGVEKYIRQNRLALELGEVTEDELRAEYESQNLPEGQGAMSRGGAGDFATWQSETPENQFHAINEQGSDLAAELHGRAQVEIPRRDPAGMLTSKTVSTLANAGITNNQLVQALEQDVVSGGYSYTAYSDTQALADAETKIRDMGYQAARDQWIADAKAGKLSKENTALGLTLINNAANSGTLEGHIDAHNMIGYYVSYARTAGQALQAMNMVNKMTPTGQLYNLVKTAENLALNIKDRTGKDVDITISPELSQRFMEAETQEARDEIRKEIYKDIASQIPNTFMDKANAWRYLAMLGNPRTHIRNIAGNLFFDPVRTTKNVVAAGIERAAGVEDRTKAVTNIFSAEDRARYRAAQADFLDVQEAVMSGGKYNDDWSQIDEYRTIFKNPLLEGARKGNAAALEAEDRFFSKRAYSDSLAGWLKANGFTGEEYLSESFDPATKDRARQYAIKEAQKATYRDLNAASDLVLSLGRLKNSKNKAERTAGIFVEGVLPFKKTPTNILVRGLEYSPVGLTKGIVDAATKVRRGDMEAAEAIDEIASGLTGTGLLALGAGLAAAGMVTGGASGDEKQDEFNELQGHQNYALEVGDTSYTIDWLAPEALPFFVGVELYKFISGLESGETEKKDWAKAVTRIAEPMLEMSMLQSLNDVINSVGSDVPLVSAVSSAAMSYLGQFVPTLGGQIERTFLEDTRQSTHVDRDSVIPTSVQYMLGTIGNKIPGWDFQQRDYVDAWGRRESTGGLKTRAFSNFLSPGYLSNANSTAVDKELQRLYDAGYDAVLPSMTQTSKQIADRTSTEEGAKRYLTAEEYLTMQTVKGQTSLDILSTVFQTDSYQSMSDQEKAELVERAYDYAAQMSNLAVDSEYDTSKWVENVAKAEKVGLSAGQFFEALNKNAEIDKQEGVKNNQKAFEFENWVNKNPNYTDEQKAFLKDNIKIWTSIPADPSKYHKGANAGLTMDQINNAADAYSAADSQYGDGNGSVKQGELYQAIKALGLSDKESAILYDQAKPSNWKATWYTSKRN